MSDPPIQQQTADPDGEETLRGVADAVGLSYDPEFIRRFAELGSRAGLQQIGSLHAFVFASFLEANVEEYVADLGLEKLREAMSAVAQPLPEAYDDAPITSELAEVIRSIPADISWRRLLDAWALVLALWKSKPPELVSGLPEVATRPPSKLDAYVRHRQDLDGLGGLDKYFNPPGMLSVLGRSLHGDSYHQLRQQVVDDEVLVGLSSNNPPGGHSAAFFLPTHARFQRMRLEGRGSIDGYYALRSHLAAWAVSHSTRTALGLADQRREWLSKDRVHVEDLLLALHDAKDGPTRKAFADAGLSRDDLVQRLKANDLSVAPPGVDKVDLANQCPPVSRHVGEVLRAAAESAKSESVISTRHVLAAIFGHPSSKVPALFPEVRDGLSRVPEEPAQDTQSLPAWQQNQIADFTCDAPGADREDLLNVQGEARAIAWVAASKLVRPPLSIAVFGEWGSGKSYFMNKMHSYVDAAALAAKDADESPFHHEVAQIRFNAWHYMETNLWASLVDHIFTSLDYWLRIDAKDGQEVDDVFEQLVTSRQLKLEAIEELLARRRSKRQADKALTAARRKYERALKRAESAKADLSSPAFWKAVYKRFTWAAKTDEELQDRLTEAKKNLGISALQDESAGLRRVAAEAADESKRARLLLGALARNVTPLEEPSRASWALAILGGIPILLLVAKAALATEWDWIGSVGDLAVWLSTAMSGVVVAIGKITTKASRALDVLQAFNNDLEQARSDETEERTAKEQEGVHVARADTESAKLDVEEAQSRVAELGARVSKVQAEYDAATPRGRLNAFIRARVADSEYVKHLGIIATIRRDFSRLAELMQEADEDEADVEERKRVLSEQTRWAKRILEMIEADSNEGSDEDEDGDNASVPDRDTKLVAELEQLRSPPTHPAKQFRRIILYVDDLDRCPPDKVVQVLQAIHLLLYFPLFVVVVAVDARWVSRSLEDVFKHLVSDTVTAARSAARLVQQQPVQSVSNVLSEAPVATSHDYLEKIFQVPYWVRPMGPKTSQSFVRGICGGADERDGSFESSEAPGAGKPATHVPPTPTSPASSPASAPVPTVRSPPGRPDAGTGASSASIESAREESPSVELPNLREASDAMELSAHEKQYLRELAPCIGGTPRRGIRFVNVYRIIKASLTEARQKRLVGTQGKSLDYRALIAQLAIVTGAPSRASAYFNALYASAGRGKTVADLRGELAAPNRLPDDHQRQIVLDVLDSYDNSTAQLGSDTQRFEALVEQAAYARRYSFSARPGPRYATPESTKAV